MPGRVSFPAPPPPVDNGPMPDPAPVPDPAPETHLPPPPAAEAVALGELGEGDAGGQADLAAELDQERKTRKAREVRLAELEDENHRLRQVQSAPPRRSARADWFEEL